jgi:lysyl-tRNA synthetase class I
MQPKEFFRTIYTILLGSPAGPRLAMLILAIGKENVAERLSAHL